ncbi:hypothetical protein Tco_0320831 [Tanacetum coccineum]
MCTYLKNMAGFTHNQLKNKSFDKVQKAFDKTMGWIDSFIPIDSKVVKDRAEGIKTRADGSSKRAGEDLQQETTKKKKVDDYDKEKEDLKQCFELVTEEEVAINAIPLATKPAHIVGFQIHREGRNGYYEIMRADGSAKTYLLFSQLLKEFDREDLENLWKWLRLNMDIKCQRKHMKEKAYERVLWGDLKVMFEPHKEDAVWMNLQGQEILL